MMSFSQNVGSPRRLAGALVLGLALAGCQNQSLDTPEGYLAANDYRLRHPIVITEQPETLDLPIGAGTRSLGGPMSDTVSAFAADARQRGNGRVEILVPSGARNEAAIHAVTPKIRAALQRGGAASVSTRTYPVHDATADAPIRLSYARVMATAGPCGDWDGSMQGGVNYNIDYANLGCATQANLAAMVDNPSDLLTPRASTPADQVRRANVFENFRKGESTASAYEQGVGASVAEN
ncbi:type IV pilus protein [Roseibium aquae]|uniref:Type IV pilus protein n=1 Tax=Roseibium aquae TaxID=1323746 RepID=A0A916X1K9_9HYPH|nr:CpaD family pilus assembly protein [Roseibium aquae]GGB57341.1 type IV pilus protein [Roseibium aquae]